MSQSDHVDEMGRQMVRAALEADPEGGPIARLADRVLELVRADYDERESDTEWLNRAGSAVLWVSAYLVRKGSIEERMRIAKEFVSLLLEAD